MFAFSLLCLCSTHHYDYEYAMVCCNYSDIPAEYGQRRDPCRDPRHAQARNPKFGVRQDAQFEALRSQVDR